MNVICLDGALLNFWVAKSEGLQLIPDLSGSSAMCVANSESGQPMAYQPARDWSQAGPIISNEWYGLEDILVEWLGSKWPYLQAFRDDPLKWFLRAYVAIKFGSEVEDIDLAPSRFRMAAS